MGEVQNHITPKAANAIHLATAGGRRVGTASSRQGVRHFYRETHGDTGDCILDHDRNEQDLRH